MKNMISFTTGLIRPSLNEQIESKKLLLFRNGVT